MMTRYTVLNDLHIGAPYEICVNEFNAIVPGPNVVSIGDVIDNKNCLVKDVSMMLTKLKKHANDFGVNWIAGNHELNQVPGGNYIIKDNVVFSHGDFESWGIQRAMAFRSGHTPGASALKRLFVQAVDELRLLVDGRKLSDFFIASSIKIMDQYKAKTYCCGHLHPRETIDMILPSGHRIVVLKRGINVIDL